MKKILLLSFVLFISVRSYAQLGIVGGLTSTSSSISVAASELSSKMISQYHVGLCYKIPLGKVCAIQPGIEYNVKGATLNEIKKLSDIDFKTGYVEVPVQLQAGINLAQIVRLYGVMEPFIGYAVSNSVKINDSTQNTWDNVKNRFEWGIGLGAGVELFKRVQVNLRYFWNFGPIYQGSSNVPGLVEMFSNTYCGGISLSAAVLLF